MVDQSVHTRQDGQAPILWQPPGNVMTTSRIGQYKDWLSRERALDFDTYAALQRWSVDELETFWRTIWDFFALQADGSPARVLAASSMPGADWFPDTRLNYAEHALRGDAADVVVIARSQTRGPVELTRGELRHQVARAAEGLRRLGVGRGDRVAAYLPNIPETLVAMLAATSLGAVWASCAPELGTASVVDRLKQIEPKILLAVDGYMYGTKPVDRQEAVDQIRNELPTVEQTVRVPYLHAAETAELAHGVISWDDFLHDFTPLTFDRVPFSDPLWIVFSSGTTGLPKAIVQSQGGVLVEMMKSSALQHDLGPGSRAFYFATTTWAVWNILVSALVVGSTVVLVDGNPAYPDHLAVWRTISETRTSFFSCGASLLLAARTHGLDPSQGIAFPNLRGICSTGSPLPADGFFWLRETFGPDVYVQSASGGTDVCTGFVGGSRLEPVRAGRIGGRLLGVDVNAFDEDGSPVVGSPGELVISKPMPSMPICFWNDPDGSRYHDAYFSSFPGVWRHGDWIEFFGDGTCEITGRSDATLNRGGVRLGTSEFYAVLETMPEVADSLIVHLEDRSGGLGTLYLFVHLTHATTPTDDLRDKICAKLRSKLSPRHVPDRIIEIAEVPYNLSGKKLEVPVKRILQGFPRSKAVTDGAVRNPEAIDSFEKLAAAMAGAGT